MLEFEPCSAAVDRAFALGQTNTDRIWADFHVAVATYDFFIHDTCLIRSMTATFRSMTDMFGQCPPRHMLIWSMFATA